eukprot:1526155-Lingulodinium_polyedra.AAC.1
MPSMCRRATSCFARQCVRRQAGRSGALQVAGQQGGHAAGVAERVVAVEATGDEEASGPPAR